MYDKLAFARMAMEDSHLNTDEFFDVVGFFIFYTRLEYALKEAGYLKRNDNGSLKNPPEINLASFSREINKPFFEEWEQVRNEIFYLEDRPPMQRTATVDHEGRYYLDWTPSDDKFKNLPGITSRIEDVRNNLFHGNKIYGDDIERDMTLIRYGLVVMNHCISVCANLQHTNTKAYQVYSNFTKMPRRRSE